MRLERIYRDPFVAMWQVWGAENTDLGTVERVPVADGFAYFVHQAKHQSMPELAKSVVDAAILLWRGSVWDCPIGELVVEGACYA